MDLKEQTPRVCHVVNYLSEGTAARDLSEGLNEHTSLKSAIITLNGTDIEDRDLESRLINLDPNYKISNWSLVSELMNKLEDFDIVTTHHTAAGIISSIAGKLKGKKVIAREGNNHSQFPLKTRIARSFTCLLADKIVCNSHSVRDSFSGFQSIIPESKKVVVNNGIDIDDVEEAKKINWGLYRNLNIKKKNPTVGTVGRLVEQKGHSDLIKSLSILHSKYNIKAKLIIVGSGALEPELKELAEDLNLESSIHFLGNVKRARVYKILHDIDVYAMPSLWEGCSAAAIQAAATGTPCVFTRIPSFEHQYPEEIFYFCKPGNSPSIARAIKNGLNDRYAEERKRYIKNRYTIHEMVKKYKKVYLNILDSN